MSIAGGSVPGLGNVTDAVSLPSGDILLGGSTGLARLLPNGKPDPSFGSGGSTTASGVGSVDSGAVIAVQADGKIVYAGASSSPSGGTEWEVARFTANGALDPTFGTGGIVTTEVLNPPPTTITFESPNAVLVQPDGKILVLGDVENFGGYRGQGSFFEQAVLRYNPNGTLDTGFGAGGITTFTPPTADAGGFFPAAALVLPAGKILVVGQGTASNGSPLITLTQFIA